MQLLQKRFDIAVGPLHFGLSCLVTSQQTEGANERQDCTAQHDDSPVISFAVDAASHRGVRTVACDRIDAAVGLVLIEHDTELEAEQLLSIGKPLNPFHRKVGTRRFGTR